MTALKFIIFTWLVSFIPAAYCRTEKSTSESICNITIFKEDGTRPGAVLDEWQSKMIDSCPENYTNEDIITSCEHFNPFDSFDRALYTPVTNNVTNITYMNKFCGYCNNENETNWIWSWWTSWDWFKFTQHPCDNYTSEIKASDANDLDKWTQIFMNDGMSLKTTSYRRNLQCSRGNKWPIRLLYDIIPCLVENYIYGQSDRLDACQYFDKNGKSCNKMKFIIDGLHFGYREQYKSYTHLSQINLTGGDYVVETEKYGVFYMCRQIYQAGYWGKLLCVVVSVAFLVIYLIVNFNKKYFEIFSNQLLYIYSIGLIIMIVLLTYVYLKFPVSYVSFYLARIFWTYHFIWTTLFLIVFCNIAFCMCNRCENITEGIPHKIYLSILFVFGLALPISLPMMYLNFLETYDNQCPSIVGHTAVPDVPSKNLQFLKFILDPSLTFLMPTMFVVGIFCMLGNTSCGSDVAKPATSRRNFPIVLLKMLLIMGIHWTLYKFCTGYYGNENSYTIIGLAINMDTIAQLSIDIHGVLVFLAFLSENIMFNNMLNKYRYKRGDTTRQDNNGAIETTVKFQS